MSLREVLAKCGDPEAQWRCHAGRAISTRADQVIYAQLDPLDEVYLLTSGLVRSFVGEGSSSKTSLFLRAPALFGDRDVLAGCLVSQEAAASVASSRLLCFARAEFEEELAADELLRGVVTRDLLRRYARAIRFADFLSSSLEKRVLWVLAEMGEGEAPRYETLARLCDSTSKSIGRAVRRLEDDGALRRDGVLRVDEARLAELGHGELLGLFHSLVLDEGQRAALR